MTDETDNYDIFVDHPRYGRRPHRTGLNPQQGVFHWHSPAADRIPNTAIQADLNRQSPATVAVVYYFDVKRICRDCGKSFIFFAEEQKHWYEELGFGLDSDCVRCFPCRQRQRGLAQKRQRYEELFHVPERTADQNLEMADCCLCLIEAEQFGTRQTERARMLLNRTRDSATENQRKLLLARIVAIESPGTSPTSRVSK